MRKPAVFVFSPAVESCSFSAQFDPFVSRYILNSRTRKEGFTLIEMLCSIAIISILASMLLAGIQGVREKSLEGKCLNNIKNLTHAVLQYALDYERYPTQLAQVRMNRDQLDFGSIGFLYAEGLSIAPPEHLNPPQTQNSLSPYYSNVSEILVCPKVLDDSNSYGINRIVQGAGYSSITEPSLIAAVAESSQPVLMSENDVTPRHQNHALAGFCDGHAEIFHPGALTGGNSQSGNGQGVNVAAPLLPPGVSSPPPQGISNGGN